MEIFLNFNYCFLSETIVFCDLLYNIQHACIAGDLSSWWVIIFAVTLSVTGIVPNSSVCGCCIRFTVEAWASWRSTLMSSPQSYSAHYWTQGDRKAPKPNIKTVYLRDRVVDFNIISWTDLFTIYFFYYTVRYRKEITDFFMDKIQNNTFNAMM